MTSEVAQDLQELTSTYVRASLDQGIIPDDWLVVVTQMDRYESTVHLPVAHEDEILRKAGIALARATRSEKLLAVSLAAYTLFSASDSGSDVAPREAMSLITWDAETRRARAEIYALEFDPSVPRVTSIGVGRVSGYEKILDGTDFGQHLLQAFLEGYESGQPRSVSPN